MSASINGILFLFFDEKKYQKKRACVIRCDNDKVSRLAKK